MPSFPEAIQFQPQLRKYFFHFRDGNTVALDPEGTNLPNLEPARAEALADARLIASQRVLAGEQISGQFEVADETGATLLVVPLRMAIDLASE